MCFMLFCMWTCFKYLKYNERKENGTQREWFKGMNELQCIALKCNEEDEWKSALKRNCNLN